MSRIGNKPIEIPEKVEIKIEGNLMLGQCISTLSVLPEGRYKYHENWQWINGDKSKGASQIIEIRSV